MARSNKSVNLESFATVETVETMEVADGLDADVNAYGRKCEATDEDTAAKLAALVANYDAAIAALKAAGHTPASAAARIDSIERHTRLADKRAGSTRAAFLDFLSTPRTRQEIMDRLSGSTALYVSTLLYNESKKGTIVRTGKGVYVRADV